MAVKSTGLALGKCGFNPWLRTIPWRRKWQPTPVFLSGKSRGQRSLVGYSPKDQKESDTTKRPRTHICVEVHHHRFGWVWLWAGGLTSGLCFIVTGCLLVLLLKLFCGELNELDVGSPLCSAWIIVLVLLPATATSCQDVLDPRSLEILNPVPSVWWSSHLYFFQH